MTMFPFQGPTDKLHSDRVLGNPLSEHDHEFQQKESLEVARTIALHKMHFLSLRPLDTLQSSWKYVKLRSIPKFYPMELSNRVIHKNQCTLNNIVTNLKEAFRIMGIQVVYFDDHAAAALLTPELIEAYITLWKIDKNDDDDDNNSQVCVEIQRRRGDAMTFHQYARDILDAASGEEFDANKYIKKHHDSLYHTGRYCSGLQAIVEKQLLVLLPYDMNKIQIQESIKSVEYAAHLIQQDTLSARVQGMEYLCILTDPKKTNPRTAVLASHAVLFGMYKEQHNANFRALHRFVLFLVQKRCMEDENLLLQDMVIEYDSDNEGYFDDYGDDDGLDLSEEKPAEYVDSMKFMVHFGLTILVNALEVLTTFASFFEVMEPDFVSMAWSRAPAAPVAQVEDAISWFRQKAYDCTQTDILTTFVIYLSRAETKMHNACLAGRCIEVLCEYSKAACSATKNLNDGLGVVEHAHQTGMSTSAALERVCSQLLHLLSVATVGSTLAT